MDPIRVDLVALRRPVIYQIPVPCDAEVRGVCALHPHPTEPHDRWFRIQPFRGPEKAMLAAIQRDAIANVGLVLELLRKALPDATDADLDALSLDEDVARIIGAADGKAAIVEDALKNGLSGGVSQMPPPTRPSSPTKNPPTSSPALPASPKPTGGRGKKSTSKSGTSRSLPSTG